MLPLFSLIHSVEFENSGFLFLQLKSYRVVTICRMINCVRHGHDVLAEYPWA